MSLYKQAGSDIWWASITVPGHPRLRRSTGETSRPAAQDVHDALRSDLRKADPALAGVTWGRAVLKWCAAEDRSDSEILSLTKFSRFYKDRLLTAVKTEDIESALSFCKTAGTHARYVTMINAILNLSGVKLKLTKRKDKKVKPREWVTHDQWAKLYAELPSHMKPMAEFSITTGLRQANVLMLTWSRVDLDRRLVWVEAEDTKANKAIAVPLSERALHVLHDQVGAHPEFVFTFRKKPIKEIKTAWRAANLRAGTGRMVEGTYRGFTWHGLRHTWATWHIQNGTPIEVLKDLGGWSDMRMVLNYAHHSPGYLAGYADNTTKGKS